METENLNKKLLEKYSDGSDDTVTTKFEMLPHFPGHGNVFAVENIWKGPPYFSR